MNMNRKPVTTFLVTLNTGIYILMFWSAVTDPGFYLQSFYSRWGLVPADFWHGSVYQPLTSMFLHGSWLHLLVNMIALWSLGTAIELTVGPLRFAMLYLFSGLTGALFVVLFQSDLGDPTVGASGAIMGLLAAIAVFYPRSQMLIFFFPMKARTAVILIGIASVLLSIYDRSSGISHLGHLGGLLGGILYTKFVLQLDFLHNDLHPNPSRFFIRKREDPALTMEDEILRMMEQLRQERTVQKKPEPFNELIREEPEEPVIEKRIYFDPVTGRFYVR
jgi:membrane associated rhomboid family serine protease